MMTPLSTTEEQAELFALPEVHTRVPYFDADGRDELNLAEFPLASLSTRTSEEVKTLEFRDQIFDRATGVPVDRRLTVTAAEKFGLPNSLDDEIILALIQLSKKQGFTSRTVPFSRYEIVRILGWENNGWNYRRILQALDRWIGVTLKYENAWWDRENKRWTNETFHIIERLTDVRDSDGVERAAFVWSEVIFSNLQKGHLKPLDLGIYRQLKHPAAKRLYRLLDKRFYHRRKVQFDVLELAFHKLGISQIYELGKIKQRLQPAIQELENVGFLKTATPQQRYEKHGVGKWNIIFEKADPLPSSALASAEPAPLEASVSEIEEVLVKIGVSPKKACRLAATLPEDYLRHKVDELNHVLADGKTNIANPAGYLVKSIEENFTPPKDFKTAAQKKAEAAQRREQDDAKAKKEADAKAKKQQQEQAEEQQRLERQNKVAAYLATLPEDQREALISEVIRREKAAGNLLLSRPDAAFYEKARSLAIEEYVIQLLDNKI